MGHGHESWHPDPEFFYKVGGGPMFDMGPYYLTALVALLGPVRRQVAAQVVAEGAASQGYAAAFAVGGDGTVGQVASGLRGSETALGVLPADFVAVPDPTEVADVFETPLDFLVADFTGAQGDDLDTNDDGVLDFTPWSANFSRLGV